MRFSIYNTINLLIFLNYNNVKIFLLKQINKHINIFRLNINLIIKYVK